MLNWAEHEKGVITLRPDHDGYNVASTPCLVNAQLSSHLETENLSSANGVPKEVMQFDPFVFKVY